MHYPLAKNCLKQDDIEALKKFLDRGMFTMGEHVQDFEYDFSKNHNVMTNSGSSANLLMIASFVSTGRLKAGDKVVVPAVSWSTTYFPLVQYGLIPVFVDVDHTYQIDVGEVYTAVERHNAKAVFLVNLLGLMSNDFISHVRQVLDDEIMIFLDNCEGYGANLEYSKCDAVTHSFFFSHQLNTMEGGMVSFRKYMRENEYHHALSLRAHGWVREQEEGSRLYEPSGDKFKDSFTFVTVGYCLRPLEISGLLGKIELEKWPETKKIRDQNHQYYCDIFYNNNYLEFNILPYHKDLSCFGFPFVFTSGRMRSTVVKALLEAGIDSRPIIGGNFLNQPVMRKINHVADGYGYEMAEAIDKRGLMIGNYAEDLREKLDQVDYILRSVT